MNNEIMGDILMQVLKQEIFYLKLKENLNNEDFFFI